MRTSIRLFQPSHHALEAENMIAGRDFAADRNLVAADDAGLAQLFESAGVLFSRCVR
jgi:hypothetical protein